MSVSDNVARQLARISLLEADIRTADTALKKLQPELDQAQEALIVALRQGESTGDPFKDVFIKYYGFNDKLESAYKALHESLVGHKGEAVLIAYEGEVALPSLRTFFLMEPQYQVKAVYRLGLLESDGLVASKTGELRIPISRYVEGFIEPYSTVGNLAVQEGDLFAQRYNRAGPPTFNAYMFDKADGSCAALRLEVGDEAVGNLLKKCSMGILLRAATETLVMARPKQTELA